MYNEIKNANQSVQHSYSQKQKQTHCDNGRWWFLDQGTDSEWEQIKQFICGGKIRWVGKSQVNCQVNLIYIAPYHNKYYLMTLYK